MSFDPVGMAGIIGFAYHVGSFRAESIAIAMNTSELSRKSLHFTEMSVLFVIAVATVVAILQEIAHMIRALEVTLADLLLLFIFLEVLAMVGIYYRSGKLPVRLPLYIAIVALARYIIIDMKAMGVWELIAVTSGILLITVAILALRYGHIRFPYTDEEGLNRAPGWTGVSPGSGVVSAATDTQSPTSTVSSSPSSSPSSASSTSTSSSPPLSPAPEGPPQQR